MRSKTSYVSSWGQESATIRTIEKIGFSTLQRLASVRRPYTNRIVVLSFLGVKGASLLPISPGSD